MRFSFAALSAFAALVAGSSAMYTTEVVTMYTTWCPEATTVTHGSETYSVSAPTSLTMSGGPYTVTRPLTTTTVTYCNNCAGPTAPASSVSPVASPIYANTSTVAVPSGSATVTGVAPVFTGAASRAAAGAGAGLAGLLGVVALVL